MSNKHELSLVILLLAIQVSFLESNNFNPNKFTSGKHYPDLYPLGSFQSSSVCAKEQNANCHKDQLGYEAISMLHSQIDDDHNGNLDPSESQDFLKVDLNRDAHSYDSHFHKNDDLVSVQDLWNYWVHSEVHNWTVEDVVEWLEVHVELGQYAEQFRRNEVFGALLPRLACSIHNPLYNILGVKNVKHKQKISLKATDIVLFGIPKSQRGTFSDSLFVFSVVMALAGCGLGYRQHKLAKLKLQIISNDLRNLQLAEDALKKFQAKLEESRKKQREEEDKRDEIKRKLVDKEFELPGHEGESGNQKITSVHDELIQARLRLMEAEFRLEECRRSSIPDLQQWLQLTYEIESRYIEERGNEILKTLQDAKKMCENMKRQKFKLLSSIRSPLKTPEFEKSDVKQALEEIKRDLEERAARWKEIERVTSFNITTNPGIPYLNALLRGSPSNVLSIPGMIASPSMNKISSIPVVDRPGDGIPGRDAFDVLPGNLSQSSLTSIDGVAFPQGARSAKQNPPTVRSFIPPQHLSGSRRYNIPISKPTFYVPSPDSPSERASTPDTNTNNNNNFGDRKSHGTHCNGHSPLKKE